VLYPSHAAILVRAGTTDSQLFVHDRVTHVTSLVSVTTAGTTLPGGAYLGDISGDGRFVAFRTESATTPGVYVRDLVAETTQYLAPAIVNGGSSPHLSSDGRYVSFVSADSTLVPGDTNSFPDVFVRDRTAGTTERVNVTGTGAQEVTSPPDPDSWIGRLNPSNPEISGDGRYVMFASYVSNLAAIYTPMIRDRVLHTTTSVTVPLTPPPGGACADSAASLSDDGRFVALQAACAGPAGSYAVAGASRGIYVVDRRLGTFRRADVLNDGTESDGDPVYGFNSRISGDGQWMAFGSYADNLVPNDDNGQRDVFVAAATD
jgi:Tol biopolymer transport system component